MAKIETPSPIRGTQSLLGEEADRLHQVVETFDRVRRLYGFRRVEVPVIEPTAVFARTIGESTDVVSKEMYSFDDRSGDSITLRPEFTAGICRAYLSEGWQRHAPLKLATHGPAFRYERPQKGRYRQFHQLDAEIIGAAEPLADVELLAFGAQLLDELGISGVMLRLNTLGDAQSREAWRSELVDYFEGHRSALSEDSQDRLQKNPLRILDSKDPRDRPLVAGAPLMALSGEAAEFFEKVKEGLHAAGVAYAIDPHLVRGLDYYRHTTFEFVTDQLGSQGTVIAGGRYDGLIEQLGGPHTPAVGWAGGIERLAMMVGAPEAEPIDAAVVVEDDAALDIAWAVAGRLRRGGLSVEMIATGSPRKRFDRAVKKGATEIVVLGFADGEVTRRIKSGEKPRAEALIGGLFS
ncbi:MAG: histidine--tRNA ligase [Sphingomonas sp.]|nr:histidine--tRNA ligase [Sphingomonas sp.]